MATTIVRQPPQKSVPIRQPTRTRIVQVAAPTPARRKRSSGGGGGGGLLNTGVTVQRGMVAYALGAMQRSGTLLKIPTFGQFGAEATVSLVAGFMSKGQGGLVADVALVAGLVALNQLGREGLTGTPRPSTEADGPFDAPPAPAPGVRGYAVSGRDPYAVQGDD